MAEAPKKKKKILVADDDPSVCQLVKMMLTRQGLDVTVARDGEEAFQKAVTEKPDAILLDINMPKMDGLAVCSKLKATQQTAQIPVAFLTAQKDVDSFKQALELGGLLYILKPFKPDKVISTVSVLLSAGGKSATL